MTDHFQALALPRRYALDVSELERRYRELSREVHPDRFATAPAAEKRVALERSTALNAAYHTLKDPLRRAAYFLKINGLSIEAEGPEGRSPIELSPEFLSTFLDLREAFDEHAHDPGQRAETLAHIGAERARRVENLTRDLTALPEGAPREVLLPLAQRLLELRYYDRFLQDLEEEEEAP